MSDFEVEYREVSGVLMKYGCMVVPHVLGGEWRAIRARCAEVAASPPTTEVEQAEVERRLDELLVNCVYNPNYRAFYTYRAMAAPHLREFSHCLERAVFQYYRQDFLSCALCLLPAVEGVLRSYAGWSMGQTDPQWSDVRDRLRRGAAESYPERRALYGCALADFHETWFWRRTDQADFSLSYLNRHYALHGLGPASFYRATDCHRLFLFFDLFAVPLEGQ